MNASALESARRANDATRSLERGMLSLNQIFLDMANLVTTQGDALDDVEAHVAKSAAAARGAERSLTAAREHQKKGRRKVFAIVGIAVACVVVVALIAMAGFV